MVHSFDFRDLPALRTLASRGVSLDSRTCLTQDLHILRAALLAQWVPEIIPETLILDGRDGAAGFAQLGHRRGEASSRLRFLAPRELVPRRSGNRINRRRCCTRPDGGKPSKFSPTPRRRPRKSDFSAGRDFRFTPGRIFGKARLRSGGRSPRRKVNSVRCFPTDASAATCAILFHCAGFGASGGGIPAAAEGMVDLRGGRTGRVLQSARRTARIVDGTHLPPRSTERRGMDRLLAGRAQPPAAGSGLRLRAILSRLGRAHPSGQRILPDEPAGGAHPARGRPGANRGRPAAFGGGQTGPTGHHLHVIGQSKSI